MPDQRYSEHIILGCFHFVILVAFIFFGLLKTKFAWLVGIYLILAFLYVYFRIFKREHYLEVNFRKEFMEFFLITILIFIFLNLGFFFKEQSEKKNINLQYQDYEFTINSDPSYNVVLNSLRYYYNFEKNQGSISFKINEHNLSLPTQFIQIKLPANLNYGNLTLTKDDLVLIENQTYRKEVIIARSELSNRIRSNILILNSFNTSLDRVEFNLDISGNMLPNGRFRFYNFVRYAYADEETVYFDLGKYACQNYCFGELVNAEPIISANSLKVSYPAEYYTDVGNNPKVLQQRIELNTYDSDAKKDKDIKMDFSISFIVAGIVLFGELIRVFIKLLLKSR